MKLVDLKCPSCGGKLIKQNDTFVCEYCGTPFTMDYDPEDVEHERLKAMQNARPNPGNDKKQNASFRLLIAIVVIIIVFCIIVAGVHLGVFIVFQNEISHLGSTISTDDPEYDDKNETKEPDYNVVAQDLTDSMDDFIESGKITQMNINECTYWDQIGAVDYYSKTDAVYKDAYLVTDIPNEKPRQSNRLVVIYEVTWHNDEFGDKTCYDAVYFEGLQKNPNGGVISDFNAETIIRSEAAWGWGMAYSFEDYNQCYRENVSSLGGTVTKIE